MREGIVRIKTKSKEQRTKSFIFEIYSYLQDSVLGI